VAQHQNNYARIVRLRQTADALDDQIKASISLLADTRRELLSTPSMNGTSEARHVPFNELLAYAKRISRFTLPVSYRAAPPKTEETAKPSIEAEDTAMPNGAATSPAVLALVTNSQDLPQDAEPEEERQGTAYAALSDAQKEWLNHMSKAPFIPFPNEEDIKRGALFAIQTMLEQGRDPAQVLGVKEQEEADRKAREDSERRKTEREEFAARERRNSAGRGPARAPAQAQPAFAGFDLYNEDEGSEPEG